MGQIQLANYNSAVWRHLAPRFSAKSRATSGTILVICSVAPLSHHCIGDQWSHHCIGFLVSDHRDYPMKSCYCDPNLCKLWRFAAVLTDLSVSPIGDAEIIGNLV